MCSHVLGQCGKYSSYRRWSDIEPEPEPTGNIFYLTNSLGGEPELSFTYGRASDQVFVGDWDGDGIGTVGVRRGNTIHLKDDRHVTTTRRRTVSAHRYPEEKKEVVVEPFVAIDFETANEIRGSACAVGLIKFGSDGQEKQQFTTLLRPHIGLDYFHPRNIAVHGITRDDVMGAPEWGDVYEDIEMFIGDLPLVAHNMAFDGYVLSDLASLYGVNYALNRRFCTLRLARKLLATQLARKSLDLVFGHYYPNDTFTHHDAGADARACGKVFARMQTDHGYAELDRLCPPTVRR